MFKKLIMPLGIAAAGVLVISVLVVAKPKPEPRPPAEEPALIKVAVIEAKQQSMRLSVHAQGTVTPKREIDLVAQVAGVVTHVEPAFISGGFFTPAQTLIQIDDRDYQAALLSAEARVAEAKQRLAEERGLNRQAKREWRDLGNKEANDLFMREPQLAAAQANLASAKGAQAMAELNLERARVTVPFSGRVKQTYVNLGQYVTAGTPLATVYDSTVVEVRLPLTEKQAALVNLPLMPDVHDGAAESIPVTLTGSVAGQLHQWHGFLTRTDAFVDASSRMYYAIVEVADPFATGSGDGAVGAPLLPGLFVEAEIQGKSIDNVVQLPRAALFERDKLLIVGDDSAIIEQRVNVLHRSEKDVWVQALLEQNALVSLEKQSLTPVGTTVEPILEHSSTSDSVAAKNVDVGALATQLKD